MKRAQNSSHFGFSQSCMKKKARRILGRLVVESLKDRVRFVGALLMKFCANNKETMINFHIIG
jgi:hypothetical protein